MAKDNFKWSRGGEQKMTEFYRDYSGCTLVFDGVLPGHAAESAHIERDGKPLDGNPFLFGEFLEICKHFARGAERVEVDDLWRLAKDA